MSLDAAAGDTAADGAGVPSPCRVGFVTVAYSPGALLADLLDSIESSCSTPGMVVIADNGSVDDSVQQAARRPGVRVVHTGSNIGYGAAINRGIEDLEPEVTMVLITNPDVVLHPGSVDALLAVARRHPEAGSVGPKILRPDGSVYPSARELPTIGRGIGHALTALWWPGNPWTRAYRRDRDILRERTAGWLSGSCLLVRREAFTQIGGFDPKYFMYFEDVDLGERLARAGWSNIYAPSAAAVHLGGHSTERHYAEMIHAHHRSAYRYLSGRYPHAWQAPLRWALRVALACRSGLTVWLARRVRS